MEPPGGRDSRFNLGYSMNLLSGETAPEIYGNPSLGRPSTSLQQLSPRHTMVSSACGGRGLKSDMYDERGMSSQNMGLEACGVNDISEDTYSSLQSKKSPPSNGKKTKGRVKIKMEYIENKLRRYTTFSKRKTGIMKKAYELSTLTGTQVMLLVASETGHVYTFATRKLQPMITSEAGKALIQTCLNSPDPPAGSAGGDQRMSATGFEETELTYNISDEDSKGGDDISCVSSTSSDDEDPPDDNSHCLEEKRLPLHLIPPVTKEKLLHEDDIRKTKKSKNDIGDTSTVTPSSRRNEEVNKNAASSATAGQKQHSVVLPSVVQTLPQMMCVSSSSIGTTASVPLLVQSAIVSTTSTVASTSSTAAVAPSQLQTVPLLLRSPLGIGYATTSDGMVLGVLQGTNLSQPQFVAIPVTSPPSIVNQSNIKK